MDNEKLILEVVKTELSFQNPKLATRILTLEGFMKWCGNKDITIDDIKQSYIDEVMSEVKQ